ncbi:MAG: hypothetical protein ACR2PF_02295 [Rhizobiaceae bacterium]
MNRRKILASGPAALVAGASAAVAAVTRVEGVEGGRSLPIAIEHLRKAILNADDLKLMKSDSRNVTFGHSDGLIQTRDEFIPNLVDKVVVFETLHLTDRCAKQLGDVALQRHNFTSDLLFDGNKNSVEL